MIIWICFAAFLSTCFLTYLIRRYALAKSLIDIPNARSSHSIPTPRGGGLSIVIMSLLFPIFIAMSIVYEYFKSAAMGGVTQISMTFACLMIAGVGFWDDHKHIPARWRLLVHFCASALALWSMTELPAPYFFGYSLYNSWVLGGFYLLGLVWMLNLYNFMDGIDGIASIEAITVLIGAVILLWMHGAYLNYIFVFVAFAFAIAGFLVWNFPPAKIFMGDACSGFLGFTLGIIAIMNSSFEMFIGFHPQGINIWTWLVLLGVFICDATFTLIKRILNKEVWYEAHSSHAYQYYARLLIKQFQQQGFDSHNARTKSHRRVNFQMTLINVLWLFPLAAITTFYPYWAFLITVLAYLPLLFIANQLKAGITE